MFVGLGAVAWTMPALGGQYGFDWAVIGAPGNAAYERQDPNPLFAGPIGSVGYEYRISKTELTCGQWAEFVRAFSPYWEGHPNSFNLTGLGISTPDGGLTYEVAPGWDRAPADVSWPLAAMYSNWLHNGKAEGRWAFESGAYDTSDWEWEHGTGQFTGTFERSEGARYWIPSEDEWVKGVYYDPDRYGPGQGGYWQFPTSSDEPTDQTNGSDMPFPYPPVGSFPDAVSPWGLLDASGGLSEWVEDSLPVDVGVFLYLGSGPGAGYPNADWIEWRPGFGNAQVSRGLRLASAVPSPTGALLVIMPAVLQFGLRRSRKCRLLA